MQAVRVDDRRALTGDGVEAPRVVGALPFSDSDTSSRFSAKFQLGGAAATPVGALHWCAGTQHGGHLFLTRLIH